MKCPACNKGALRHVDDISYELGNQHIVVKGQRCDKCKEEFFDTQQLEKIVQAGKKLHAWEEPLTLHRKLSRSGRGTVLRIPTDIEEDMKLKGDERITISKVGKRKILIEIE